MGGPLLLMFFNLSALLLDEEVFDRIEGAIGAGIGIFALLLLALSITAYRKTRLKFIIYAIIIFALFAIQQFLDFLENTYSALDTPLVDVVWSSLTLAILVLFFLAIVKTKIS